ncbi:MAG: hypothetical protein ACK4KV_19460 [Rhodocyclaceae bacterium]
MSALPPPPAQQPDALAPGTIAPDVHTAGVPGSGATPHCAPAHSPPPRRSPLAALLPFATGHAAGEAASVLIEDVSTTARFGCKGPGAGRWLAEAGLQLPARPNSWCRQADGMLLCRLGVGEYLAEGDSTAITALRARPRAAGCYPVLREDAALRLRGPLLPELLLQTCSLNFAALDLADAPVVLTSLAGVGVTVLPGEHGGVPDYRLWCDPSFGEYLATALMDIAAELANAATAPPPGVSPARAMSPTALASLPPDAARPPARP